MAIRLHLTRIVLKSDHILYIYSMLTQDAFN